MRQGFKNVSGRVRYSLKVSPRLVAFIAGGLCSLRDCLQTLCDARLLHIPLFREVLHIPAAQKKHRNMESKLCDGIVACEVENLIKRFPVGSFIAVTHEFLITELLKADSIEVLRCDKAYVHNLCSLQNNMFCCKKCHEKKTCSRREKGAIPRQFYYVKFIKHAEERPNPIR